MRTHAFLVAAALLVLSAAAHAQDEAEPDEGFARRGGYVGGGFVYGIENFDLDQLGTLAGEPACASNSPGFDIRGGYRFHPHFAAEGNVQYYADFDIDVGDVDVFDASAAAFTAAIKGFPMTGRIQPYGLFGIGVMSVIVEDNYDFGIYETDSAFAMRVGGGVDVYVTEKFLLNFDVGYLIIPTDVSFGGIEVGANLIPLAFTGQYRF